MSENSFVCSWCNQLCGWSPTYRIPRTEEPICSRQCYEAKLHYDFCELHKKLNEPSMTRQQFDNKIEFIKRASESSEDLNAIKSTIEDLWLICGKVDEK